MPPVALTSRVLEECARVLRSAKERMALPETRFDELRSSFVATDANGIHWSVDIETRAWNRLENERWVAGLPPRELFLDSEILSELESLKSTSGTSPTDTAPRGRSEYTIRRCPKCNQVISGEWTFCPTDGTPIVGHIPGRPSWTQATRTTDAPPVVDDNGSVVPDAPRAAEPSEARVAEQPRVAEQARAFEQAMAARRARVGEQALARVGEPALAVDQPQTPDRSRITSKRSRHGRAAMAHEGNWNPIVLCLTLALFFAVLAFVKGSGLGLAVALLFVVVAVVLARGL
jgi:hypothetical protein